VRLCLFERTGIALVCRHVYGPPDPNFCGTFIRLRTCISATNGVDHLPRAINDLSLHSCNFTILTRSDIAGPLCIFARLMLQEHAIETSDGMTFRMRSHAWPLAKLWPRDIPCYLVR
jgi:hypothetical protein